MLLFEPDTTPALLDALSFAAAKHRDQRRPDGCASPFVNHVIETVKILAETGGIRDRAPLLAAVLHDILEDTRTTPGELTERFGGDVSALVAELTDEPGLPTDVRRLRQVARIARASAAARQIRLADKIANLRSLPADWSRAEGDRYLDFAERIAAAVHGTNTRLDTLFVTTVRQARAALRGAPARVRVAPLSARAASLVRHAGAAGKIGPLLRLLQRLHARAEEIVGDIIEEGVGDQPALPVVPKAAAGKDGRRGSSRGPRFSDPSYKARAEPGIGSITFTKIDARYVAVSIDGAAAFRLPAGLALLLEVIAFVESGSTDGFTPFQSRANVAAVLEKLTGRHVADHAVVVAIGRLRTLLEVKTPAGPLVVETDGPNVRLRLRRVTS